jgi:hypothetical protein
LWLRWDGGGGGGGGRQSKSNAKFSIHKSALWLQPWLFSIISANPDIAGNLFKTCAFVERRGCVITGKYLELQLSILEFVENPIIIR